MLNGIRRFLRRLEASEKFDLPYIMGQADPSATLEERVEWAAALVEWIRSGRGQTSPTTRLRFVLRLFERQPEWRARSAAVIRSILRDTRHVRLFTEIGLPSQPTFGRELRGRLLKVFVPEYLDSGDLAGVQAKIFYEDTDPDWIEAIPDDLWKDVLAWLADGQLVGEPLIPDWPAAVREAARILTARCLEITLRDEILRRSPNRALDANPFLSLGLRLQFLNNNAGDSSTYDGLRTDLAEGRRRLASIRAHLENTGVSVDLVYQLDRIRSDLVRLARLCALLERAARGEDTLPVFQALWLALLRGHVRDVDFGAIFKKHVGLLSKKIVERTGNTGEHAIAQTPAEYRHILWAAAGGGVLTAGTAFVKYLGPHGGALFGEFLFNAVNYGGSFLLMHIVGFKLATKQPAVTAAALAGKLKEDGEQSEDEIFVDEIARIARSQFAAVVGNLAAVIPASLMIDALYVWRTGHSYLSVEKSYAFLDTIHPVWSLTLMYAAMTGVLLWLSSMIAGWVENASVYARLPDVMRTNAGLRWLLGEKRAVRWADGYLHNVAGVVGAISLGVLLAGFPIAGSFFGLPLDARHVTLSTGSVAFSFASIGLDSLTAPLVAATAVGIGCIGLLNFGVSFALALFVAMRARDLSSARVRSIFRRALKRLARRPGEFLFAFPPRGTAAPDETA